MNGSNRREFLSRATAVALSSSAFFAGSASGQTRKMKIALTPGSIGVTANQKETIALAHDFGFEAVQPFPADLAPLSDGELQDLLEFLTSRHLDWAAANLSVDFRREEATFLEGIKKLPAEAQTLQRAKVTRVGTWLMPMSNSLTYLQFFKQTAQRLREAAGILGDHGMRLGLEYVGTKSLWSSGRYPFVHTMAETKELIAEINKPNVGFVLDSWHWWSAEDTVDDILSLKNQDIVSCDLNDAPAGIPKAEQRDGSRELPVATGVIDAKAFLGALQTIGYDGPVRAEPFNKALNDMSNDEACSFTIEAMEKAFALIGG
jgi:sugar phosphate isomerase/epimerase